MSREERSSLDALAARLRKARAAHGRDAREGGGAKGAMGSSRQLGAAYRVFVELLAGVLVGAGLGWVLDRVFATQPWLMLAMLFLGFAAGVANTIRVARRMTAEMSDRDDGQA